MNQEEEQYKIQTSNDPYIEPNVLQYRLDTDGLIDKIKAFLAGGRITYEKDIETGHIKSRFIKEGKPIANDLGVQSIVSWIAIQVNSAVVQGNWKEDRFNVFLESTHKELAKNLLVNSPRYNIDPQDRSFIVSGIMGLFEMFVSRLLDNAERDSYAQNLNQRVLNLVNNDKKRNYM